MEAGSQSRKQQQHAYAADNQRYAVGVAIRCFAFYTRHNLSMDVLFELALTLAYSFVTNGDRLPVFNG